MKPLHLLLVTSILLFATACPDDEDPPPADSGVLPGPTDSGVVADGGIELEDAGQTAGDSGVLVPDAGMTHRDASEPASCNTGVNIDGVVHGKMPIPRTILPLSGSPRVFDPITEATAFDALAHTRFVNNAPAWHAQISSLTQFDSMNYEHFLYDDDDGSTYAAVEMQMSETTGLRFYHADGNLFREYTPGGEPGFDIIGRSRQSQFFIAKYDISGQISWVTRFGPNSNGDRAGRILSIGFVGDRLRIVGGVEDSTTIVFAPGTSSSYSRSVGTGAAFWAELDRASGDYVSGSARFVDRTDADSSARLEGQGHFAHNASGETAMQIQLRKESQPATETFTIGADGLSPLTVTATRSTVAFVKLGADGEPAYAATLSVPALFGDGPSPRAVAISQNGTIVAGGQFSSSEATAIFRGTTGVQTLDYVEGSSFLVAFDPSGGLAWVKELVNESRNAISRIMIVDDAIYVMGTHAQGERIGALTVPATGYTLTKLALADGEAEWVRVFTPEGQGQADAYSVWYGSDALIVPVHFTAMRIAGASGDPIFRIPQGSSSALLGAFYFSSSGDFLQCEAVATGVGELSAH